MSGVRNPIERGGNNSQAETQYVSTIFPPRPQAPFTRGSPPAAQRPLKPLLSKNAHISPTRPVQGEEERPHPLLRRSRNPHRWQASPSYTQVVVGYRATRKQALKARPSLPPAHVLNPKGKETKTKNSRRPAIVCARPSGQAEWHTGRRQMSRRC
jgi:hypothetical protein